MNEPEQTEQRIRDAEVYGALINDSKLVKIRGVHAPGDGDVLPSTKAALAALAMSMTLHEAAR